MGSLSAAQRKALESKLRRLSKRVDPKTIDDVLDVVFQQVPSLKNVSCTLSNPSSIAVQSQNQLVAEVRLPRAKTILRLLCARLATRASEQGGREVSPYGDAAEFETPAGKLRVRFENTPDVQKIEIAEVPARRRIGRIESATSLVGHRKQEPKHRLR
jgi:hypothetical protein